MSIEKKSIERNMPTEQEVKRQGAIQGELEVILNLLNLYEEKFSKLEDKISFVMNSDLVEKDDSLNKGIQKEPNVPMLKYLFDIEQIVNSLQNRLNIILDNIEI